MCMYGSSTAQRHASAWLAVFVIVATASPAGRSAKAASTLRPIPKAVCGPSDRTETVQGQTTLAERFAPGPTKAFNCNLDLVGQFEGEGAGAGLDAFDHCAYYSIIANPQAQRPGVAVLNVSDSRRPSNIGYLTSKGMLGAFESVAASPVSKLLVASKLSVRGDPAPFDVYDLSVGCEKPKLLSSTTFEGLYSHFGDFSADGRTYFGSNFIPAAISNARPPAAVFALDLTQPASPRLIATWLPDKDWITHSAVVGKGGARVYVSIKREALDEKKSPNPNGLAILDASEVLVRKEGAQFRLISTYFWHDSYGSEGMQPLTVDGHPYLAFSDNLGSTGSKNPVPANACDSGKATHGFARILDLSDERNPVTASRLMLEAAAPKNCESVVHDPVTYGGYGSFGCTTDNPANSRILACSSFEAGLRVFDIRDPRNPKEIAYYKPPARRTDAVRFPGSWLFKAPSKPEKPLDNTADSVIAIPRFKKDRNEIWFTSCDNGFQVVRFTERFRKSNAELFGD